MPVCLSLTLCCGRMCRQDGAEICIGSSAGDPFDLSTYNTSGGLPAENLGRSLISQGERHAQIRGERERESAGTVRVRVEAGIGVRSSSSKKKANED